MAVIVMSSKLYNNLPILITRCSTSCVQLYVLFTVVIPKLLFFIILRPYQGLRYDNESDLPLKLLRLPAGAAWTKQKNDNFICFTCRTAQETISCSLVLKLKVFYFRVFTGHTRRCITRAALFFKNVPGTFFNATHQVKAIAIGIVEVNPLGELFDCSTPLHSTCVLNQFIGFYFKRDTPLYPLLHSSLSSIFPLMNC